MRVYNWIKDQIEKCGEAAMQNAVAMVIPREFLNSQMPEAMYNNEDAYKMMVDLTEENNKLSADLREADVKNRALRARMIVAINDSRGESSDEECANCHEAGCDGNGTVNLMHDEGAKNLIVGIVQQAMKDYRGALCECRRQGYDINTHRMVCDCERFFRSGWFYELTGFEGETVIESIRKDLGIKYDRKGTKNDT